MNEHPMMTAQRLAENTIPLQTTVGGISHLRKTGMIAALQWLADPKNVSDDVVEAVAIARYVDAGVDNNDPATWVSYPEACKAEYRMSAINMITALANALIKEIEALKGGAS